MKMTDPTNKKTPGTIHTEGLPTDTTNDLKSKFALTVYTPPKSLHVGKKYSLNDDGTVNKVTLGPLVRADAQIVALSPSALAESLCGEFLTRKVVLGQGAPKGKLPGDSFTVTTARLAVDNPDALSRTADNFAPHEGDHWALMDADPDKGTVFESLDEALATAVRIEPALAAAPLVITPSASSWVMRKDGRMLTQLSGFRVFVGAAKELDSKGLAEHLRDRASLAGFAYVKLARNGRQLKRSLFDGVVGYPSGVAYSCAAHFGKGLTRRFEAKVFNPSAPPLKRGSLTLITEAERVQIDATYAQLFAASRDEAERLLEIWCEERSVRFREQGVLDVRIAALLKTYRESILSDGSNEVILPGETVLYIGAKKLVSAAEVLANPAEYVDKYCCSPLEPEYDNYRKTCSIKWDARGIKLKDFAHGMGYVYRIEVETLARASQTEIDAARAEAQRIGEGEMEAVPDCYARVQSLDSMLAECVYVEHGKGVCAITNPAAILKFDEFCMATAASQTLQTKVGANGSTRQTTTPTSRLWLSDPRRLSVYTRTFRPGRGIFTTDPGGQRAANLWLPSLMSATPDYYEDYAQPFFDHVAYLIEDEPMRELFLDYLAHIEQRPGEKAGYGWLMVTDEVQGIGRNWMTGVLARVWASYTALDFNLIGAIKDGFTGRLSRKLLVVVNEIVAAQVKDRHEFVERCKGFVTDETIEINPKYGMRHTEFMVMRWIVFSNHVAAMPLSDHDRRFAVVRNPGTPQSVAYYSHLYQLMRDSKFIASVRRMLAERTILGDIVGRAPISAARTQVIEATRSPMDTALREILDHWPGDLIRSSVCTILVRRLLDLGGNDMTETQMAALTYAYRRCGFVPLSKKLRFGSMVERVVAMRDSTRWEELLKIDPQLVRDEVEGTVKKLPWGDAGRAVFGDEYANWGLAFDRLVAGEG